MGAPEHLELKLERIHDDLRKVWWTVWIFGTANGATLAAALFASLT